MAGVARLIDAPIAAADLPPVDLLITHSHYDHLDIATLKPILARHPQPRVLVPLGLKKWMQDRAPGRRTRLVGAAPGRPAYRAPAAGPALEPPGFERHQPDAVGRLGHRLAPPRRRRALAPGAHRRHGLQRGAVARSASAWRPGDLVAVPIGAYEPREFMRAQHNNPDEAVRIARLLNARRALGIHWGTFEISHEPLDQPPRERGGGPEGSGAAARSCVADEAG